MLQDYNRTSKGTERIQPWTMELRDRAKNKNVKTVDNNTLQGYQVREVFKSIFTGIDFENSLPSLQV
jgi:hypothetical protein